MQVLDPSEAYLPAAHEEHTESSMPPTAVPYLPPRQARHAEVPEFGWYIPLMHETQLIDVSAPVNAEKVPAEQPTQVVAAKLA